MRGHPPGTRRPAAQQRDLGPQGRIRYSAERRPASRSGAKLSECLAFLRDGDALTVTKPVRLARSTTELLTIEADLSKRGVDHQGGPEYGR